MTHDYKLKQNTSFTSFLSPITPWQHLWASFLTTVSDPALVQESHVYASSLCCKEATLFIWHVSYTSSLYYSFWFDYVIYNASWLFFIPMKDGIQSCFQSYSLSITTGRMYIKLLFVLGTFVNVTVVVVSPDTHHWEHQYLRAQGTCCVWFTKARWRMVIWRCGWGCRAVKTLEIY